MFFNKQIRALVIFILLLISFSMILSYNNDFLVINENNAFSLSFEQSVVSMSLGERKVLNVNANGLINDDLIWNSSNKNVVSVDDDGNIVAVGVGSAIISVSSRNDSSVMDTCTVTVLDNNSSINHDLTNIELSHTNMTVEVGSTGRINVSFFPNDASDKSVTWNSSDSSVLSVDENGNIKALKVGVATVTVSSLSNPSIKSSCLINVKNKDLDLRKISIKKDSKLKKMKYGDEYKLNVSLNPSNANNNELTYKSSDSSVVSIDGTGKIKIVKNTSAVVTITVQSISNSTIKDTIEVHVNPVFKKLGKIKLSKLKGKEIKFDKTTKDKGLDFAQGFAVAGKYYIAAKRNKNESKVGIFIIKKKNNNLVRSFVVNNTLGHVNGLTYSPKTGNVYSVMTIDNNYRYFSLKNALKNKFKLSSDAFYENNSSDKLVKVDSYAIANDKSNNLFYVGKKGSNNIYVYKDNKKVTNIVKKVLIDTAQDIGAYDGKILVIRYNSAAKAGSNNIKKTRNAIDVYRSSNGEYLGTYILASDGEVESIDYYGKGKKFAILVDNQTGCGDCIYKFNLKKLPN